MKCDPNKYTYRIEWSDDDQLHIARCLEFPSLAAHGETLEKALKEIEFVVAESIRWIEEEGGIVPEPLGARHYKGNITLRVPPDVHRNLAILSAEQGVSINWCFRVCRVSARRAIFTARTNLIPGLLD